MSTSLEERKFTFPAGEDIIVISEEAFKAIEEAGRLGAKIELKLFIAGVLRFRAFFSREDDIIDLNDIFQEITEYLLLARDGEEKSEIVMFL